jgi:hypothetical protein
MVVAIAERINNGPWGAMIAMLATRIIIVQKFDIGVVLLLGNKAPRLNAKP